MHIEAVDALIGRRNTPRRARSRVGRKRRLIKVKKNIKAKQSRRTNR